MMIDFIDKTSEQSGTPLNRANMLAIQGFISASAVLNADGSITQTNSKGETLTTRKNADGSITKTFKGEKIISKTIAYGNAGVQEDVY